MSVVITGASDDLIEVGGDIRHTAVPGGHTATLRRWVRVGPWAVYVVRYRAGADEAKDAREALP